MTTYTVADQCKICAKIETKLGRIRKEEERIRRWRKDGKGLGGQPVGWEEQGFDGEAGQSRVDVWEEIASLLQERVQTSGGQAVAEDGERSEPGVSVQRVAGPKASVKSLSINPPRMMTSSNSCASSGQNLWKEPEQTRGLIPSCRFFAIDASKDATLIASWQGQVLLNTKPLL